MKPVTPLRTVFHLLVCSWLAILLMTSLHSLNAQDIHLSHIHASPVYLNPAMNGIFNGDVRTIMNVKSQWNTFTRGYKTAIASADMKLNKGFSFRDDMAIGAQVIADKAGDLDLSLTAFNFSFSYLKSLDASGAHILAMGFTAGLNQNRVDLSKAKTREAIDVDPHLSNPDFVSNFMYLDLSAGISWFLPLNVDDYIYLGASQWHLNRSMVSFMRDHSRARESHYLFPRSNLHGGASLRLGPLVTIKPSFIYMRQGPHEEVNLGTFFSLNYAERSYLKPEYKIHLGMWYRWSFGQANFHQDAVIASVRYDNKGTIYTFSYDINVSDLVSASRNMGGPELSIIHYLDLYRPDRTKFRVKCPDF